MAEYGVAGTTSGFVLRLVTISGQSFQPSRLQYAGYE